MKKQIIGALALAITLAGAAQAQNLRMIESWPESNTTAYMPALQFKKNLEASSAGLTVDIFGPETVPAFEQLTPTTSGVFDVIYTYPAYHSKALTIATNAMEPDMEKIRSSGVFDVMDTYFQQEHNLKLLANISVGTAGYHCYLREPLSEAGDWAGRKLRGVSTYVPVIEALGGVAVNTDMSEVYSGLERGVVDGACAPRSVFLSTRHYEVAKYRVEPAFGQLVSYMAMNLDKWNSLTADQQAAVEAASLQTEVDSIRLGNEAAVADEQALKDAGVEVQTLSDENAQKVVDAYYDGVWALARDCCGAELADTLRTLATEAGLTR